MENIGKSFFKKKNIKKAFFESYIYLPNKKKKYNFSYIFIFNLESAMDNPNRLEGQFFAKKPC
jgi:hypothetical protein